MHKILLVWTFFSLGSPILAQETNSSNEFNSETQESKHFVGVFVGNTIITQSKYQLPTIGVEYIRELNHRFGVGLVTELEIGSHIIQKNEEGEVIAEVERESALLLLPSVFFKVYKGLTLTAGYGVEFEKKENLALSKVGVEYSLKMHNPKWLILPSVSWDHTELFDGIVYGITAGYSF